LEAIDVEEELKTVLEEQDEEAEAL